MINKNRKTEEIDRYISNLSEGNQQIASALRNIILEASSKLTEEFKWSMPNYSYKGLVCYLQTSKNHINLGFHKGNELEEKDTKKLLQGTGKTMRHIRIKKMDDIDAETFTLFIKEAVALNEK